MAAPFTPLPVPADDPIEARAWQGRDAPRRILAIRLHALGGTLITLPYLNALRNSCPSSRLDFVTRREVGAIPKSLILFDRVHEIPGSRRNRAQIFGALRLLPRLLARRYDVVLGLQRNLASRMVRRLLAAPAWSEFDRFSPKPAGERTRLTIEAAGLGPLDNTPELRLRNATAGLEKLLAAG